MEVLRFEDIIKLSLNFLDFPGNQTERKENPMKRSE
jgi:hypothetical protein